MTRVVCPCCKGAKVLPVYEDSGRSLGPAPTFFDCCHCQGRGWIPAEVEEPAPPVLHTSTAPLMELPITWTVREQPS